MLERLRVRRAQEAFLNSCRNLKEGRAYSKQAGFLARCLVRLVAGSPIMGLEEEGKLILDALEWLEANSAKCRLGEDAIRRYHRMIVQPSQTWRGEYRKGDLTMSGGNPLAPAPWQRVPALMKELDLWLSRQQDLFDGSTDHAQESLLEVAVQTYHRIGRIHPFVDANGRVARIAMDHLLRRYRIGYVIFPPLNQEPSLWQALLDAGRGNLEPLKAQALRCLQKC
jgi:fido (protein-threonine AMPylation protein)